MKLSMQSNPDEGLILIVFDDEGRGELLHKIETAIAGEDHEFGTLEEEDEARGAGWVLNDFYNIICEYDAEAPLHADTSISISGGKAALSNLCMRIRALPQGGGELELPAKPYSKPHPRRLLDVIKSLFTRSR